MLNSVKLHDDLWSISLASMFNWSNNSVSVRPANNANLGGMTDSSGDGESGDRDGKVILISKDPSSRQDSSSLYHQFPFATNFNLLSRSENYKENIMKQAGGKSFTIDSLLGTSGAQVVIQNRFHPASHPNGHTDENEGTWALEKHQLDNGMEHRTSGFHSQSRKERLHPYANATDKSGDKNQKISRRSAKSKRVRTIFTPEQLERLEAEFERQQYMVGPERLYLASSLYLTEAQVKVWFQNRRIKWRKQHLEMQQQRLAIFRSKSSLDNGDADLYDEDSDDDGSKSETFPETDSSPSSHNVPLLTSFSGSIIRERLNDHDCISEKSLENFSKNSRNAISTSRSNNPRNDRNQNTSESLAYTVTVHPQHRSSSFE